MYPFEIWSEERQQLIFIFHAWNRYRNELFRSYPVTQDHARIEISICNPCNSITDVPTRDWNPHHDLGNYHLTKYDCFYDSDDWSTIFEVYPANVNWNDDRESKKIIIEEGHMNPWGEQVRLMSTSSNIFDDHAYRFVFFRGRFWQMRFFLHHEIPPIFFAPPILLEKNRCGINWSKEGF